nr:site-2 protease family protein [Rhodovibrio salinarum]
MRHDQRTEAGPPDPHDEQPQPAKARRRGRTGWLGLGFLGLKLGPKVTKLALAGASVAAYSTLFSWQFALLLVAAIFIHELGHVWSMRRCGMPVKGIYLLPFVGGVAVGQADAENRLSEAQNYEIAMMGPVFGLASVAPLLAAYGATGSDFWGASAAMVALVNLFNLLPIFPLDGGRVLRALFASAGRGPMLGAMAVSLAATAIGLFVLGMPMLAILLGIGMLEFYGEFRHGAGTGTPMRKATVAAALIGYFLLAALLAGAIFATGTTSGGALALDILRG